MGSEANPEVSSGHMIKPGSYWLDYRTQGPCLISDTETGMAIRVMCNPRAREKIVWGYCFSQIRLAIEGFFSFANNYLFIEKETEILGTVFEMPK